jgi:type IV pilus assembly protein PilA
MKKFLKGSQGFTLVELMVVVAIIGILSAVAIPNFKKYQAKSKQSEAKIQLAALYTAEVSAQSDFNTYATCIQDLGYERNPRGYYWVGFAAANAVQNALITTGVCTSASAIGPTTILKSQGANPTIAAIPAGTSVTAIAFVAGAGGQVSATGGVGLDQWTINEAKNLVNVVSGI